MYRLPLPRQVLEFRTKKEQMTQEMWDQRYRLMCRLMYRMQRATYACAACCAMMSTQSLGSRRCAAHALAATRPLAAACPALCRQEKIQTFFGPGIIAQLTPTEQGEDVALVCDGSGAGRGGGEKKDVLPPLMPGMKPRQQA